MDRFAQFFRCPLFSESSMERELQAVESEHSNNKNDDSWRLFQACRGGFEVAAGGGSSLLHPLK